ncbi:MAG: Gfo/Idh/MocA family oxidoreductase [Bdellovibrionota bacterium]
MKKLRVGIAGYGIVGKRRDHFIGSNPHLETVAVCDRVFKEPGQLPNGVPYFTNYEDLLAQKLDVLFVCLTNDIAAEVTSAGLRKGLHVFCEKPPGRDLQDIASVRDVEAEHSKLKLMYGFNHRYHDSIQQALSIVRSGELGRVINIRGIYGKSRIIPFNTSDWRSKRAVAGGGILLDQGIHMVDLIRLFAGEMKSVHSFISNDYWKHDVEDNAYALMKNGEGVVVMLHSSATQWRHRFQLEIALERGNVELSGILSGTKSYGAETITVSYKSDGDQGDPKEVRTRFNEDPSWQREIDYFARAIVENTPIESGSSLDAFKTMELVYKIYCADAEWRARYDLSCTIKRSE